MSSTARGFVRNINTQYIRFYHRLECDCISDINNYGDRKLYGYYILLLYAQHTFKRRGTARRFVKDYAVFIFDTTVKRHNKSY